MYFEDLFLFLFEFIRNYDYLSLSDAIIKEYQNYIIIMDSEYLELFYLFKQ